MRWGFLHGLAGFFGYSELPRIFHEVSVEPRPIDENNNGLVEDSKSTKNWRWWMSLTSYVDTPYQSDAATSALVTLIATNIIYINSIHIFYI